MSLHIEAKAGEVAPYVLMPGDPLRTKYIAEKFLEDAVCYNRIRGTFGYTGTYKGLRVSVQTSGIGMPAMDLYAQELLNDYGVQSIIRIGTCGSYQERIETRALVLAMSVSTDSAMNSYRLNGTYAPCADFDLLAAAHGIATAAGHSVYCGNVISTDAFYGADPDDWKTWAAYNVLAVEMEACALYTRAAQHGARALAILTVTDCFVGGARLTPEERERSLDDMIALGLETQLAISRLE